LKPYGDFVKTSEERLTTVTALENSRFNWERTVRQLAHVIAPGVWISSFKGSVAAGSGSSGSGGSGVRGGINGPAIELSGCSPSQETVARMMARMRNMDGSTEVVTSRSEKGSAAQGAGASSGAAPTSGGEGGCPKGYYSFDLVVGLNGGSNGVAPPAPATGPGTAASGAAQTAATQSSGTTGASGSTGGTP
jgi:hypothetical protein